MICRKAIEDGDLMSSHSHVYLILADSSLQLIKRRKGSWISSDTSVFRRSVDCGPAESTCKRVSLAGPPAQPSAKSFRLGLAINQL